jgi:hypothetical protein
MVVSGMDWRCLLLGVVCLVDGVVFIRLVRADWRERWATRNKPDARDDAYLGSCRPKSRDGPADWEERDGVDRGTPSSSRSRG